MNNIELITKVVTTIRENKGVDMNSSINETTHLRNDLGFDSLDLAEFTVRIEKETGVDVFSEGIVQTVGEVLEKLS